MSTSLFGIARMIEELRPGTLFGIQTVGGRFLFESKKNGEWYGPIDEVFVHDILQARMARATYALRLRQGGWSVCNEIGEMFKCLDAENENCATRSLFGAFLFLYG